PELSGLETEIANDAEKAFVLKKKIERNYNDITSEFSFVIIDCPPSLSLLTIMALVASRKLVVPLQAEFFALEGLSQLIKTIDRIKNRLNPSLEIEGILLTMFDKRNKLSFEVEKEAKNFF
ncbi:MAG: ParA family protein, partial [Candidatus Fonsibacter sp.]